MRRNRDIDMTRKDTERRKRYGKEKVMGREG